MQHTVILALASMLAVVTVVFVAMLWRACARSRWWQRWQAAGAGVRARGPSQPGHPAAAPLEQPPASTQPFAGSDGSAGHPLRTTLYATGRANTAVLHP